MTIETLVSFMCNQVETVTVLCRGSWVSQSLGNSPQLGKEGPLSQAFPAGPSTEEKSDSFHSKQSRFATTLTIDPT